MKILSLLSALAIACHTFAQGHISYDYMSASRLRDQWGNEYGSGNMQIITGTYSLPLSSRTIGVWPAA